MMDHTRQERGRRGRFVSLERRHWAATVGAVASQNKEKINMQAALFDWLLCAISFRGAFYNFHSHTNHTLFIQFYIIMRRPAATAAWPASPPCPAWA